MIAFAGNSLLCRLALKDTHIDAATFTAIRLISGTLVLWLIVVVRRNPTSGSRSWLSAFALFAYAACFSFAYLSLPAGTGALLLFGAVQATMIGYGLWAGERLRMRQAAGFIFALGGLVLLVLPGLSAPPLLSSALMIAAGIAWGVYSLRGRYAGEPIRTTAENFLRAVPLAIVLSVIMSSRFSFDRVGCLHAILSGGLASGVGYAIWYTAVRGLRATQAATVQLSVPVIAAGGGIAILGEQLGLRFVIASGAILGGIALVIFGKERFN
jgi:drug/metabolite transporter (DMT)-like permease